MHLFEFALRDFVNLERYCGPQSTILVHDCNPLDAAMAARKQTQLLWSGDVWKLIPCLKKYRPDLKIRTVDVAPTGLTIIRGLDPASSTLSSRLREIEQEFVPLDFDEAVTDKAQNLMLWRTTGGISKPSFPQPNPHISYPGRAELLLCLNSGAAQQRALPKIRRTLHP